MIRKFGFAFVLANVALLGVGRWTFADEVVRVAGPGSPLGFECGVAGEYRVDGWKVELVK